MRTALRKLVAEVNEPGGSPVVDPSPETSEQYHRLLDSLQGEPKAAAPHFSQCERLGGFSRAKGSLDLLAITGGRVPTAVIWFRAATAFV